MHFGTAIHTALFFRIIPIGVPILVYLRKKKILWLSPVFVFATTLLLSFIFTPSMFEDMFTGSSGYTNGLFWLLIMGPSLFVIAPVVTVICYIIEWFRKRR